MGWGRCGLKSAAPRNKCLTPVLVSSLLPQLSSFSIVCHSPSQANGSSTPAPLCRPGHLLALGGAGCHLGGWASGSLAQLSGCSDSRLELGGGQGWGGARTAHGEGTQRQQSRQREGLLQPHLVLPCGWGSLQEGPRQPMSHQPARDRRPRAGGGEPEDLVGSPAREPGLPQVVLALLPGIWPTQASGKLKSHQGRVETRIQPREDTHGSGVRGGTPDPPSCGRGRCCSYALSLSPSRAVARAQRVGLGLVLQSCQKGVLYPTPDTFLGHSGIRRKPWDPSVPAEPPQSCNSRGHTALVGEPRSPSQRMHRPGTRGARGSDPTWGGERGEDNLKGRLP